MTVSTSRVSMFGKEVRNFRMDTGITLKEMASRFGVTIAYLSAVERGKTKITGKLVSQIAGLYLEMGRKPDRLVALAESTNGCVSVDGLLDSHKLLVSDMARMVLDEDQVLKIREFLKRL